MLSSAGPRRTAAARKQRSHQPSITPVRPSPPRPAPSFGCRGSTQAPSLSRASVNYCAAYLRSPVKAPSNNSPWLPFFSALMEQSGARDYRVETKNLNASDKSSRTAGDVQILIGKRVVEAYEVTANRWDTKLAGIAKTVKDHDLTRMHIIAPTGSSPSPEMLRALAHNAADVSVLDLWGFVTLLTSALTRSFRAQALERLYEYLDRYQPDIQRVNLYVRLIASHQLKE